MAQNLKEELTDVQPLVDVLVGPDAYRQLPNLIRDAMLAQEEGLDKKGLAVDLSEYETYHDIVPDRNDGVNAWIAVMRGCDNFCSFCVVPTPGGENAPAIQKESSRKLAGLRTKDSSRSHSWTKRQLLPIRRLGLCAIDHCRRGCARYQTCAIHLPAPQGLSGFIAGSRRVPPNICKQIHLPLQSGSDRMLGLMNRTYTNKEYRTLVDRIRNLRPTSSSAPTSFAASVVKAMRISLKPTARRGVSVSLSIYLQILRAKAHNRGAQVFRRCV